MTVADNRSINRKAPPSAGAIPLFKILVCLGAALISGLGSFQKPLTPQVGIREKEELKFDTEVYRGVEVSAKEILLKLERCSVADQKAFIATIADFAMKRADDNRVKPNQVGNECWFLLRFSRLTVTELLQKFTANMRIKVGPNDQDTIMIIHAEPNYVIQIKPDPDAHAITGLPNDDYFQMGKLWGLNNIKHTGFDINVLPAWKVTTGSKATVVGVVDTGIEYGHPDLSGNIWFAPKAFDIILGGESIHCLEGSHGYNALGVSEEDKCNPYEAGRSAGHGTHVAGIIGAAGANHIGVVGVNWTTQLIGLKFIGRFGKGRVSDAVNAIEFAIKLREKFPAEANIRVLNASWGYGATAMSDVESKALRDVIERAGKKEMLFAASAGNDGNDNDGKPHYPSSFPSENIVSVTALAQDGSLASPANVGKHSVDLAAPGSGIYSTYLSNSYFLDSGTSMATPFVSGAAALILSKPGCTDLPVDSLKLAILHGATPTRAAAKTTTGGRLNVFESIKQCP